VSVNGGSEERILETSGVSRLAACDPDVVREGMRMEFRAEAFNVFNHPQFDAPDTSLGDGSFGQITGLTNPMRELQLGLKFYF
jgi:hypothetical protein